MRNLVRFLSAGVLALLLAGGIQAGGKKPATTGATCGEYGTSIQFAESPTEAAKQALKAEKLVMVLHISGYFEDPDFT